jgi:hypothetical protein
VRRAKPLAVRRQPLRFTACLAALGCVIGFVGLAGCSSSSSPAPNTSSTVTAETPPDLAKFLQLPVATPSACPTNVSGSTDGRSSPWVGHVDVSVYIAAAATNGQTARLGRILRASSLVHKVYFESQHEAYEEFQRLYTCWTAVPESQTPPSYRVVLTPIATFLQRNALVQRLVNLPAVDSVSCDPAVPCTNIVPTTPSS